MSPIFMIGTQRSGSNLLRLMLNQLNDIASPHPPHILERMYPLIDVYGDLTKTENIETLVNDVCRLVELNPVKWNDVNLDRNDIVSRLKDRSLLSVYEVIYDLYAESQGASTWCCKSLSNIKYISEIREHFDNPKFIYLYRDGRDVALSFQKAVVGEKHIYNIAKEWSETQKIALDLKKSISDKYLHFVSYEDLTQNPEDTARSLCEFLGADYVPEMFDFYKTDEAKNAAQSSELWGNVTNPIIKNNSKKYRDEMTFNNIFMFESIAGHIMDELGYSRDIVLKGNEKTYSDEDIRLFTDQNLQMKLDKQSNVDIEDKERREKQSSLLNEIKSRIVA